MKRLTLNNLNKAVSMIIQKGYPTDESENIAINCFALQSSFGGTVEDYIARLEEKPPMSR